MLPNFANQYSSRRWSSDPKPPCKRRVGFATGGIKASHFHDFSCRHLGFIVSLPARLTAFIYTILAVHNLVAQKQVRNIATQSIIATMQNEINAGIYAGLSKVGYAVRSDIYIANAERAVAVNESTFALPFPAFVGRSFLYVVPKVLNALRRDEWKGRIRFGHGLKFPFKFMFRLVQLAVERAV